MDVNDILFPYFGDNNSKETKNSTLQIFMKNINGTTNFKRKSKN